VCERDQMGVIKQISARLDTRDMRYVSPSLPFVRVSWPGPLIQLPDPGSKKTKK